MLRISCKQRPCTAPHGHPESMGPANMLLKLDVAYVYLLYELVTGPWVVVDKMWSLSEMKGAHPARAS
eukprot:362982-Chlamydomonas_euryale.AAC.10